MAQTQTYLATVCNSAAAVVACTVPITGVTAASLGVTATVALVAATNTFTITGSHAQCAADAWTYTSATGQITTVPAVGLGLCI